MIRHATYAVSLAAKVFRNAIDVRIQFPFVFHADCRFASIRANDDVVIGCCVTHGCVVRLLCLFCLVACLQHACLLLAYTRAWRAGASPTLHVGLIGCRAFSTREGVRDKDTTDCYVGQGFLKKYL